MKYESEILYDLMKRDGLLNPSQDNLPYESELKEKYVDEVKGAYPKVIDYRPEWMNYNLGYYIPADFPIESIENVTSGTVNNVVPYAFKSAILTGNTIKNLTLNKDIKFKQSWSGGIGTQSSLSSNSTRCSLEVDVEPNTTYSIYSTVELYIRQATADYTIIVEQDTWTTGFRQLTTTTNVDKLLIGLKKSDNSSYTDIQEAYGNIIVKGDYIIDDYFEDLKSVKMPVLTTIGKNLFNKDNAYVVGSSNQNIRNEIFIKPNTTYTFYANGNNWVGAYLYDKNDILTREVGSERTTTSITFTTTNEEVKVILQYFNGGNTTIESSDFTGVQLEYGTQITSYEPYKTNILTVNEDVELRGIGNVKDELNVATGELTQRFTKIVLDGVNYKCKNITTNNDNTNRYDINFTFEKFVGEGNWVPLEKMNASVISDKAVCVYDGYSVHPNKNAIASYNGIPVLFIEDKTILSIEQANQWLQQNPITVQYELKTPTIKTVDLTNVNQDGVPSTFRPFEGTMHIQTDGTPIKPLFSGEIPVEATTQNLASFVNLEGVERTVNEYEEMVGDVNDEQLL